MSQRQSIFVLQHIGAEDEMKALEAMEMEKDAANTDIATERSNGTCFLLYTHACTVCFCYCVHKIIIRLCTTQVHKQQIPLLP